MIGVEGDDEKPNEKNVLGFSTILNLQAYEVKKKNYSIP